ncbi:MAG: aspartate carbamoyltransferase catalytic subunit [Xanthomonadales bacterium]|nr:aspartate carbamoyltransferase catalytic subunit [Xanthomonadales bacterium]
MAEPLRHLLDIDSLTRAQLESLLRLAHRIKADPAPYRGRLDGALLTNLFFESSTRTRMSFEIAARRLGMQVVNFSSAGSSVSKGETLLDSFRTVQAMGPDVVVFRHSDRHSAARLAEAATTGTHLVNAGDGSHAHPSQALLDMMTLQEHFEDFASLRVLIAGDLRHSRVTHSDVAAMRKLGVGEIRLASPATMQPDETTARGTIAFDSLDEAVEGADVVMMLRIQHERLSDVETPEHLSYYRDWGLTPTRLAKAAPGCRVMHPGPMNRGVEIDSEVADGPQSLVLQQVANGVYARMALLLSLVGDGAHGQPA